MTDTRRGFFARLLGFAAAPFAAKVAAVVPAQEAPIIGQRATEADLAKYWREVMEGISSRLPPHPPFATATETMMYLQEKHRRMRARARAWQDGTLRQESFLSLCKRGVL